MIINFLLNNFNKKNEKRNNKNKRNVMQALRKVS